MPRKKNWKRGKARKEVLRNHASAGIDISGITDGRPSHPLPSSVSDVRPSVCRDNHGVETGVDIAYDTGVDIASNHRVETSLELGNDTLSDTGVETKHNLGNDFSLDLGNDTHSDTGVETKHNLGNDFSLDLGNDTHSDTGVETIHNLGIDTSHDHGNLSGTRVENINNLGNDTNLDLENDTSFDIGTETIHNLGIEPISSLDHGNDNLFDIGVEPMYNHGAETWLDLENDRTSESASLSDGLNRNYFDSGDYVEPGTETDNMQTSCNNLMLDSVIKDTSKFIFGTFHQGNQMFHSESRNSQCVANAICALIYIYLGEPGTSQCLDDILIEGDKLHKIIVRDLRKRNSFQSLHLNFEEIPESVIVMNRGIAIGKGNIISGVCIQSSDVCHLPSLHDSLNRALIASPYLLFIIGSVCSAIFVKDKRYCLFDSHSHGQDGLSAADGTSILATFDSLDDLVLYMYALYQSMTINLRAQFDLLPIKLKSGEIRLPFQCKLKEKQSANLFFKEQTLIDRYFKDQHVKMKRKRDSHNENDFDVEKELRIANRREYMRNYKRNQRLDCKQRQKECELSIKSKNKTRQNDDRQVGERFMSKISKQKARQDPVRKIKEQMMTKRSKQKARQNPVRKSKEQMMTKRSMQKARQNPVRKSKEQMMTKRSMQKARQNPVRKSKEQMMTKRSMQKARQNPVRKSKEQMMTKRSMQKARQNPERQLIEQYMSKESKRIARQDPDRQVKERHISKESKRNARQNPSRKDWERIIAKKSKQAQRLNEDRRNKDKSLTQKSMNKCRASRLYKEGEMLKKQNKRASKSYIAKENERNKLKRRSQRSNLDYSSKERNNKQLEKYGSRVDVCIEKFKKTISKGPVYVCTCCNQTWFKHSVILFDKIKSKSLVHNIETFSTGYISVENCEWICKTCHEKIKQGKIPPMSVYNKNEFPLQPKELELHQLEERLVSLRIPFMQIRELPRGGQLSIKGNVVNVPVDIQPVLHSLPRTLDSNCTIPVKLKKKLSYNKCDFTENVRPLHVLTALHWLVNHSSLYKESGVTVDDNWVQKITSDCTETVREFLGRNTVEKVSELPEDGDDKNYDSDHFSEIDETEKIVGNSDTMIDAEDVSKDNMYTFAPGEGQTPISLYQDPDSEYLSFPTIFCGQRRLPNEEKHYPMHYSDTCKLELRHIDRRVASNIPNIFFKLKKIQLKQVSDKVHLALRRCKTEGKSFTASQMLDKRYLQSVVRLDEGYYIFRSLRNSPPYFEARKKDVFAMIRQLGLPTWFTSLSSADTRWYDLLNMLSQINNGLTLSKEEVDSLSWIEKTKLVQKDPVTCVRYFDNRVQEFINTVLKSPHNPLGKVTDFFYRVEFQQRGSPHIHMLMWIDNSPKYQDNSLAEVTSFIDEYVSCYKESGEKLVDFQIHKHSKSCRKKQKAICRFGFPIPPMKKTTILEPLCDSEEKQKYRDLFNNIQRELDNLKDTDISFEEFLSKINVTEEEYIKAVQSSLYGPKVFLKRKINECRINAYMKPILKAWGANHDLQFVLDAYACAVYIVSYISKAQRGMSILMNEACKEAKQGNMDLRQQVRHIGNKFLNSVEVSAQEACYLLLQLPLTRASRDVVFINTSTPAERTFLLKSKESLEKLSSDSTNIEADNVLKRYSKRPKALENWCLADYVSQLDIKYNDTKPTSNSSKPEHSETIEETLSSSHSNENDDTYCNDDELLNTTNYDEDLVEESVKSIPGGQITLKNGIVIKERKHKKVIRYVRFSRKIDIEQFCRERLLLFTPWRNENIDLKKEFDSYQERYRSLKSFIENKARQYERNTDELDHAMEQAQNEEEFDGVAPGNEQSEQDDATIGAKDSESFIFFDPDRPEYQKQCDIAADVGLNVASVDISIRRKTMPDSEYRDLIQSLNVKQREFFVHVLQTVKLNQEKLLVFLSGGAGVGKSVLVSALFEALQRYLTSDPGDNPENCKILLCAPTGKAAFHIHGITLHSAFRIPASQGFNCSPLCSDTLNTLRTKYKELSVVMIDEVSMVGNNMLKLVNERLKQIKGSNLLFGGVHMIFIGDLFQLKPVMDGWIFENLKSNFGPLATNLWQDTVVLHELDEIMRQKNDKQFAEILNRLREGNHTQDDIETLKGRLTDANSTNYPQNTIHLFNTNEKVNNFNVSSYQNANTEKVNISALDHVLGDDNLSVKQQLISKLPKDPTHTAGLSHTVGVAVGMIYDLCLNLDVDDGLVNGSSCVIRKIEHRQKNTTRPSIVWVSFSDENIGSSWRSKYRHLYHNSINPKWTPIFDSKRNFVYLRKTFVRIQIPLRQSTAKTVHKSQGDTLTKVVINMDGKRVFPHAHYVAISRAKTMDGLNILNLNESKISVATKVKEEMVRLRETRKLKLCYTPVYMMMDNHFTCLCHNIQSYKSHQKEFFSDPNVKAADCICILETWLTVSDQIDSLQKQGYQLIRADGKQLGCARPHRGIIVYVRDDIPVLHSFSVTEKDCEMVVLGVKVQNTEIVIATVYKSPTASINYTKNFLAEHLEQFKDRSLIIQGDININIMDKTTSFETYMQDQFNCTQHVQKPTHFSGSLIDHIYSNISSVFTDVIECVWSDHSLIYSAIANSFCDM